jgi:acyl-coenzyme A thioesterase PaaI-like protein
MSDADILDGTLFGPDQPCFGCGPAHPIGFRLRFEREGDEVVTRIVPGERYQGPPGIMHGGLVATLADEVGAWACIALLGKFGFTASMSCKLHHPVRTGTEVEARARIAADKKRIVDVAVRLLQNGTACYTGDLRFVVMDEKGAERLLGRPLPADWARFQR